MPSKRPVIRRRRYSEDAAPAPPASAPADSGSLLDLPLDGSEPEPELGFGQSPEGDPEARASAGVGGPPARGVAPVPEAVAPVPEAGVSGERPGVHPRATPAAPPRPPRHRPAVGRGVGPPRSAPGSVRRSSPWPWVFFILLLPVAVAAGYLLRPLPPVASVSQDLLDFGEIRLGEEVVRGLRLTNDGESALEVLSVEILEDPDGVLRRGQDSCGDGPLAAGESCELRFVMAPISVQPTRARVRLLTNAPAAQRTVPMIGRGIAPELSVEPEGLRFREATVGERGERGQVRLSNRGSAALRVDSVALDGLGAADFVLFEDRCSRSDLAPGTSCVVGFEFVPTAAGDRRASLRVVTETGAASFTELQGTGLPQLPVLTLAPDRIDFGSLRLGKSGGTNPVELRNEGNGPLDIRGARVVVTGEAGGDPDGRRLASFPLQAEGCAGRRLEPGAGCRLTIGFSPQSVGPLGAMIEIEHSAAPGIHRLPLVGVGTAPRAELSVRQLSFGEVPMGKDSAWQRLEIRNSGTAELRVERLSLRGADARAFQISSEGCLRAPIPPSQSCSAEVRFRARRDGPHRAEVHIRHDAGDGFESLAINGLGTSARLGLDPAALDFGTLRVGSPQVRNVTLRNSGRAALSIRGIRLQGSRSLRLDRDCSGSVIPAGGTCVVTVRLAPSAEGSVRARLVIAHDGSGGPQEVPIQAVVEPKPQPRLSVEPSRLDFTERYLAERSPIRALTLRNDGNAPLSLRETEIEGGHAADFQLVPGSCADFVPARSQCTVGVAFAPTAAGSRRAILAIRHNADGGVARIPLGGIGVQSPQ